MGAVLRDLTLKKKARKRMTRIARIAFFTFIAVFILLLVVAARSQDAEVIELSESDSTRAHEAWLKLQGAQSAWDKLQTEIEAKYVRLSKGNCEKAGMIYYSDGSCIYQDFNYGFEFSKDFKFVVPKRAEVVTGTGGYVLCSPGSLTMENKSPNISW